MNDIHYAMLLANLLYGVEINEPDFEEMALVAFNLIGNKRYTINHVILNVDCEEGSVTLPCGVEDIEAVTRLGEDYQTSTNQTNYYNWDSAYIEQYIEARKYNQHPLYSPGGFVKFHREGNKLYVDKRLRKIRLLYKGTLLDENGFPLITNNEANAIACYIAYITTYKKALQTMNGNTMSLAEILKRDWNQKVNQARSVFSGGQSKITQNEIDEIMDGATRWDRKAYGRSQKIVR